MLQFQLMNPGEQQTSDKSRAKQTAQSEPVTADAPLRRSRLSIIGLVLAFLIPPLGMIVSMLAWHETKKKSLRGKKLAILGTVWGLVLSLPFLFFLWLFIYFGGFKGNGAQRAAKPFIVKIEQAGGKKICDNGDNGYGIDNNRPWYNVYYQMPDSSGLTNKIKNFASQEGYHLGKDLEKNTEDINQLLNQDETDLPGDEQLNTKSDYLTGRNGDKTLSITIYRQTSVALNCNSGQYGRKQATGSNTAILSIDFSLPETNL